MKKISILLLILISFFTQGCMDEREIQITDISVCSVDNGECMAGKELILNFKYWAEARDTSEIGIQISIQKKDETEAHEWNYLDYNPFANYLQNYTEKNSEYIVENSPYCSSSWSTMYYSFKGSKALSSDESVIFKVKDAGEYFIRICIKDESRVTSPLVWNRDSEIEFKVNPATEETMPTVE